ncbi:Seipin [Dactylellina cionopaga]|nr:Seipin [Dactylellina cionopaga]
MPLVVPSGISRPVHNAYSNVTSKSAQKAYIQTILAIILAVLLLGFACVGYILFYLNYIPQIGLDTTVHLIYGESTIQSALKGAKSVPNGSADISRGVLMHNQAYDIYISLTLPTSPHNFGAGNFMVSLKLFENYPETPKLIATSKRAACLTYRSDIIHTMDTVMRSPLYISGWRREQETLNVLMLEGEKFAKNRLPNHLTIGVGNDYASEKAPEAYESKVLFKARFGGLRYFMYNYRITAFVVFTSIFWMTELFWAAVAWIFVSSVFFASGGKGGDNATPRVDKSPPSSETERRRVHPLAPADDDSEEIPRPRGGVYATPEATPAPEGNEGDDEDDSEDASYDRSDGGGRTPTSVDENTLQGSAQDSGIGTSMSEHRGEGLARRRSGRRNE